MKVQNDFFCIGLKEALKTHQKRLKRKTNEVIVSIKIESMIASQILLTLTINKPSVSSRKTNLFVTFCHASFNQNKTKHVRVYFHENMI